MWVTNLPLLLLHFKQMHLKRTLPLITILITASLLGIIFFQLLWLNGARTSKKEQLDQNISNALQESAYELMQDKPSILDYNKQNNMITELLSLNSNRSSVILRFSKEEIYSIIRKAFNKNKLQAYHFEFAVEGNSLNGALLLSDNFYKLYADSNNAANNRHIIPLEAQTGSLFENLTSEELLSVIVPDSDKGILREMIWFIVGAILFTTIITTAFVVTVRTLLKQKKVSEIKNDFINNMTHEFKTPLATISLAVDALKNEKVLSNPDKLKYFTGVIKEENVRMNKQVESILQAALLDKQEVELALKPLSAHNMIDTALHNIQLQIEQKNGTLKVFKNAANHTIMADEVHFTNLVNNLLDNAVKYSKDIPVVTLTTSNKGKFFIIKVEDNGIGMSKDTLNQIFEKFYRAHTGNVHNVKGFGLGLSYVKTMVEAHKGTIKAESALGKGSIFTIQIPMG